MIYDYIVTGSGFGDGMPTHRTPTIGITCAYLKNYNWLKSNGEGNNNKEN